MVGGDWTRDEVEATVADYFAMLRHELAGLRVNKAEHNERLRHLLRHRSKGAVEFKHANVSAVLTLHGYPYIDGYKPRFNLQALLEQVVLEFHLYRVFNFGPNARLYMLPGSISRSCLLDATQYRAFVQRA